MTDLEKVERLKALLISRATGGFEDEGSYRALRDELSARPRVKSKLPRFVAACRTLQEFWGHITEQSPKYQGRRDYLREQFEPVLSMLESEALGGMEERVTLALAVVRSDHVRDVRAKMVERLNGDPDGAVTAARQLLETVCKHILSDLKVEYPPDADLPRLNRLVCERLRLTPGQRADPIVKQLLGGCTAVVEAVGALRNKLGDAHGRAPGEASATARHAELAVHVAGAAAAFLVGAWEDAR